MTLALYDFVLVFLIVVFIYKVLDRVVRWPRISPLSGRCILVTGCDTGFGHEISLRLDGYGCHVFAACLTEKGAEGLRRKCSSMLHTLLLDVTQHDNVTRAYDEVKKLLPRNKGLWGIINNAGMPGKIGPAEWLHLEDYQKVIDVNLKGLIDVSVTFLPLVKKERGRIVNTASMFGRVALENSAPYAISKFGVEAFSDSLRRQLRPFRVSVHLIEPGFFNTNMGNPDKLTAMHRRTWEEAPEAAKAEYGREYIETSGSTVQQFVSKVVSDNVHLVVDAYEHALFGRYPRARYVLGADAKYFIIPTQALPEWLADWIMRGFATRPIPKCLM